MPTVTYKQISSQVLSSAANTITFDNIPQTYKDLVLILRVNGASLVYPQFRPNGSSTSLLRNYLTAGGTSIVGSADQPNGQLGENAIAGTGNQWAFSTLQISNYTSTTLPKNVLHRANRPSGGVDFQQIRWSSTAAITSITINTTGVNFGVGSGFWLYGLAG